MGLRPPPRSRLSTVLLRMAGLDPLDGDAEAQPSDREAGEIVEAVGTGEGEAVIAPDGAGQAALAEQVLSIRRRR